MQIVMIFLLVLSFSYCKQGGQTQIVKKDMGAMHESPKPTVQPMTSCYPQTQPTVTPTATPHMHLTEDGAALHGDDDPTPTPYATMSPCPTYRPSTTYLTPTPRLD